MSDVFLFYYAKRDPKRVEEYYKRGKSREARAHFLRWLAQREPAFITVQTAATVYKHLYATAAFLDGNSPQSFGGVAWARQGISIESDWSVSNESFISIKRRSGQRASLNEALEAVVVRLWPSVLGHDLEPD